MRYTDPDTKEVYVLFNTPELQYDISAHQQKYECPHTEKVLTRRKAGNAQIQVRQQCTKCGSAVGVALKQQPEHTGLPSFDETIFPKFEKQKNSQRLAILKRHHLLEVKRDASYQKEYDDYLSSPIWKDKRAKVLSRANGKCEGCLEATATEVHHLTYKNIYKEFLFELVAVCNECHKRLHPKELSGDDFLMESPCAGCRWKSEVGFEDWCGILNVSIKVAMAPDGECGPMQQLSEPLR
jgi:hypothetical protein